MTAVEIDVIIEAYNKDPATSWLSFSLFLYLILFAAICYSNFVVSNWITVVGLAIPVLKLTTISFCAAFLPVICYLYFPRATTWSTIALSIAITIFFAFTSAFLYGLLLFVFAALIAFLTYVYADDLEFTSSFIDYTRFHIIGPIHLVALMGLVVVVTSPLMIPAAALEYVVSSTKEVGDGFRGFMLVVAFVFSLWHVFTTRNLLYVIGARLISGIYLRPLFPTKESTFSIFRGAVRRGVLVLPVVLFYSLLSTIVLMVRVIIDNHESNQQQGRISLLSSLLYMIANVLLFMLQTYVETLTFVKLVVGSVFADLRLLREHGAVIFKRTGAACDKLALFVPQLAVCVGSVILTFMAIGMCMEQTSKTGVVFYAHFPLLAASMIPSLACSAVLAVSCVPRFMDKDDSEMFGKCSHLFLDA